MVMSNLIRYSLVFLFCFLISSVAIKHLFQSMDCKMDDLYVYLLSLLIAAIVAYGYYFVSSSTVSTTPTMSTTNVVSPNDLNSNDHGTEGVGEESAMQHLESTHQTKTPVTDSLEESTVSHLKNKRSKKTK